MAILILGYHDDEHVQHMERYLGSRGCDVVVFDSRQFPQEICLSFDPHADSGSIRLPSGRWLAWTEILDVLELEFPVGPAAEFRPFFLAGKRGFVQERRTPPGAIVRLMREDDIEEAAPIREAEKKVG